MNKLPHLKCCINIEQDNTYGILLISYVKVNDGNIMMLLLIPPQTLPVHFVHEKKIFVKFKYNSQPGLQFGRSEQLGMNPQWCPLSHMASS